MLNIILPPSVYLFIYAKDCSLAIFFPRRLNCFIIWTEYFTQKWHIQKLCRRLKMWDERSEIKGVYEETRGHCFVTAQIASIRNVDPSEKHYIRATSSLIFSGTSKATRFCRVYNALVGQTLNCTLFTHPTWMCISCRCGYLNHNEVIMVLLVQDCCSFLPLQKKGN